MSVPIADSEVPDDLEDRKAAIREIIHLWRLQDLRGAEFQSQLRLARDEGLLTELLQNIGYDSRPSYDPRLDSQGLDQQGERQTQPIQMLLLGLGHLRTAFGWLNPKSLFR